MQPFLVCIISQTQIVNLYFILVIMISPLSQPTYLRLLEQKLEQQTDPKQRLVLLDQAITQMAFTDVLKAQTLLAEQEEILKTFDNPDLRLNFHLNTAIVENQLYNYMLSEMHFKYAFKLLEERGDVKQQAEAYIDYTGVCINQKQMDVAMDYLEKATKLLAKFPDRRLSSRIVVREGYIQLLYSDYGKAIESFLEAEKEIVALDQLEIKDHYFLTLIYSGLGKIYSESNEAEKSVRAYLRVLDMCKAVNMRYRLSWHYLHVGFAFMTLEDYEEAEAYFEKAMAIVDDISQHSRAMAYANLGYCFFKRKDYKRALTSYRDAQQLFKEKGDISNLFQIERWKAELYLAVGKKKKVEDHFIKAYEYAKMRQDFKQLSAIFNDIAKFYASVGDYKNAYEYRIEQIKAEERHSSDLNSRKTMELEVKYEAEKKKQEAQLLELKATKLQLKALRAQMNPHFMYNALNSIQNYITSNDAESAAKYLAKFSILMRQSLEYSELEIIPLEKEIEFLENYLNINQKLRFEDNLNYKIEVADEIEEDIFGVPTMIIQPYVENAIEHGLRKRKNGWVTVKFSLKDEDTILCEIEDNGIGRDEARQLQEKAQYHKTHRSMGTEITQKRLNLLHPEGKKRKWVKTHDLIDKTTGKPLGTKVEVLIPIKEV